MSGVRDGFASSCGGCVLHANSGDAVGLDTSNDSIDIPARGGLCQEYAYSLHIQPIVQPSDKSQAQERVLDVIRIHKEVDMFAIADFLTAEECRDLILLAEGRWERSLTSKGVATGPQEAYATSESESRTSYSARLPRDTSELVQRIQTRVAATAGVDSIYAEDLVVVRYNAGQYFREHHDGCFRPTTILIYLNDLDDNCGGETEFNALGFKITPQKGMAIVWKNLTDDGKPDYRLRHAGLPLCHGTKFAVNCFVNSKPQVIYMSENVNASTTPKLR